jgi:hypothetical protein
MRPKLRAGCRRGKVGKIISRDRKRTQSIRFRRDSNMRHKTRTFKYLKKLKYSRGWLRGVLVSSVRVVCWLSRDYWDKSAGLVLSEEFLLFVHSCECIKIFQNVKSQCGGVLQLKSKIYLLKDHLIVKNESIVAEVKKRNELSPCMRYEFAHGAEDSAFRRKILPPTSRYKKRTVVSSEKSDPRTTLNGVIIQRPQYQL